MGMIEIRLGDGTFVCRRSEFLSRPLLWAITGSVASEAQELVEARRLIEVELVGFAAERSTADELKEVGTYLDIMEAKLGDRTAFEEADINFHLAVGKASHSRILQNALQLIRNLLHEWIGETLTRPGVPEEALDHHKQIFLALAKRNPDRARAAMRMHLDTMAQYLREQQLQADNSRPTETVEESAQATPN
jgi:GntR family transcriptional regulator, transcriptional repressor for pyruvate dehydrogenase complex